MKRKKRIVSMFIVIVLLLTATINNMQIIALGQTTQGSNNESITKVESATRIKDNLRSQMMMQRQATNQQFIANHLPNEIVEIIVELHDNSLMDTYSMELSKHFLSDSFDEYAMSYAGQVQRDGILVVQDSVINKISGIYGSVKSAPIYHYTSVMNGFSIQIPYALLHTIKDMPEVKSAYVAPVYELIRPTMSTSVSLIDADKTWENLLYKGEGTVVAIVDTGLNVTHEAFSYAPANPKLTKEAISEILANNSFNSENYINITADDVYLSPKLPYVFDYSDKDTNVSGGNDHGTHVAGTVAGSANITIGPDGEYITSNGVLGVAPEAQLVIFKVFNDAGGGAYTSIILAALDDAVKLGVDAINMSLGSVSGFSYESKQGIEEVYQRIAASGINLVCSAGNNYSATLMNNNGGFALTSNPDTSVVGSPSTYGAAISVASVMNSGYKRESFLAASRYIQYNDNAVGSKRFVDALTGTYEYVEVGTGTIDEFLNVDVTGKIALIKRGSISFEEKATNAYHAGAVAAIIYNNTVGEISMSISNYHIPAISITQDDGLYLFNLETKQITVDKAYSIDLAGYPSDFSSWGVTPDLKLKPEIAAPGEGIRSAVAGGYANMSGTSMASPHIAGATAIVKQYINNSDLNSLTPSEKEILINRILMSTAKPVENEVKVPFSPRKQGAGMLNVYNAVTAGSYLYVDGQTRTKIELGDDLNKIGVYDLVFHVQSVTGSAITYNIDAKTITEDVLAGNFIAESPKALEPYTSISSEGGLLIGNELTLAAYENAKITVRIELSESDKAYLDTNFANGEFVEGFVYLRSEYDVDLSIPFLGFYGDWTKAPIMDGASIYEDGHYSQTTSEAYSYMLNDYIPLGSNLIALFEGYDLPYHMDKITISPNGDGFFDAVDIVSTSLLRNARTIKYEVTDKDGNIVYASDAEYERKSFYNINQQYINTAVNYDPWYGLDPLGVPLPDGIYTYKITGTLDYDNHVPNNVKDSWQFTVNIDNEGPELLGVAMYLKDGKRYIDVLISDNHYVSYIGLYSSDFNTEYSSHIVSEDAASKPSILTFDITDYPDSKFGLGILDYALNESSYIVDFDVTSIALDKTELTLKVGEEATLNVIATPNIHPVIIWESSDPDVVTVVDGKVTAHSVGNTYITAKTLFGKEVSCEVTVIPAGGNSTPTPTGTPTATPTPTVEPTATPTPTVEPTATPTPTVEPTATPTPTVEPTATPTPTVVPTASPIQPSYTVPSPPSITPTVTPTPTPADAKSIMDSIKVGVSNKTFYVDTTRDISLTLAEDFDIDKLDIEYKSSNNKVVTVSEEGKLTAIKAGKATITVTYELEGIIKTLQFDITIKKPYISVVDSAKSIKVGKTYTFKAKAYGIKGDITWSVSDSKIATVNKSGKVTAKKKGTTYVIMKVGNVEKKVKITIN